MDSTTQPLISRAIRDGLTESDTCLHCGEPWGRLPPVVTASLGALRRCRRCGTSSALASGRLVSVCEACGLPFLLPDDRSARERCEDCEAAPGEGPADPALAAATATEVLHALSESWSFVGAAPVSRYLDRLVRQLARVLAGEAEAGRVLLFREDNLITLGLPGGTLLLSLGTLGSLENEAELTFVMAHELAHLSAGHTAQRLVSLGLRSMSAGSRPHGRETFKQVALDLVRLGHGRARERQADRAAAEALIELGYDPASARHYLERIEGRMERGDPDVADLALAHPDPRDRIRRIDSVLAGAATSPADGRVNREVFRRLLGPGPLADTLVSVNPLAALDDEESRSRPGLSLAVRVGLGLAILVVLWWLVRWLMG